MSAALIAKAKRLIKERTIAKANKDNTIIIAYDESDSNIPLNLEGQLVIILDRDHIIS